MDVYSVSLNTHGLIPHSCTFSCLFPDANLIAVAHSVSDASRSRLIQKRVDAGQCAAANGAGPQFVSEVYYGPDDTTSGNIGDSWCSMGRIGLFDAMGRKRFGEKEDLEYFNEVVLAPVQRDVIAFTWMHERYAQVTIYMDFLYSHALHSLVL